VFDRKSYFDSVRASLFGSLTQQQVEGQEAILGEWELQVVDPPMTDLRFLAYMLATTYHECSAKMWPIEEIGKGEGQPYGKIDPETGQAYYGRGYVQLTWRENYKRATTELGLKGDADLEWHPEMALDPQIAADVMFLGMREGWFRKSSDGRPQTLYRYFNNTTDDPFEAREIINGDKNKVPNWSTGVSVGQLIKGYHGKFLTALQNSEMREPMPPEPLAPPKVWIEIAASEGVEVVVSVNGDVVF